MATECGGGVRLKIHSPERETVRLQRFMISYQFAFGIDVFPHREAHF
jgi:hypothetical protein